MRRVCPWVMDNLRVEFPDKFIHKEHASAHGLSYLQKLCRGRELHPGLENDNCNPLGPRHSEKVGDLDAEEVRAVGRATAYVSFNWDLEIAQLVEALNNLPVRPCGHSPAPRLRCGSEQDVMVRQLLCI